MTNTNRAALTPTYTFAILAQFLSIRREQGTLTGVIPYNLKRQMRLAGVTIRELAAEMQVTLIRVRTVRSMDRLQYLIALDYQDGIERVARKRAAAAATWNAEGLCARHGLTPDVDGRCAHCACADVVVAGGVQ